MKKESPTRHKFLPNINNGRLRARYKNEKDSSAKERYMHGPQARRIAAYNCREILQGAQHHTRLAARAEGGLDNLHDVKRSGPKCKLTAEQLVELKEDLQ